LGIRENGDDTYKTALVLVVRCCLFVWLRDDSDMTEAQKKSETIALALEKEIGVRPFAGWNIHNGTLTNVTVSFQKALRS
jgi:hypothetical protein